MRFVEEPWCGTCGKTTTWDEYVELSGDCYECFVWWKENAPKEDDD